MQATSSWSAILTTRNSAPCVFPVDFPLSARGDLPRWRLVSKHGKSLKQPIPRLYYVLNTCVVFILRRYYTYKARFFPGRILVPPKWVGGPVGKPLGNRARLTLVKLPPEENMNSWLISFPTASYSSRRTYQ